jgi:hypothetical protein
VLIHQHVIIHQHLLIRQHVLIHQHVFMHQQSSERTRCILLDNGIEGEARAVREA